MIENSQEIFGDQENILSINFPSKSNKKKNKDSHNEKIFSSANSEELKISSNAPQDESPTFKSFN